MKDGGPAFPTKHPALDPRASGFHTESGMTLRDYFAAKAMHAIIAAVPNTVVTRDEAEHQAEIAAVNAYMYSDAMLAAREKGAA